MIFIIAPSVRPVLLKSQCCIKTFKLLHSHLLHQHARNFPQSFLVNHKAPAAIPSAEEQTPDCEPSVIPSAVKQAIQAERAAGSAPIINSIPLQKLGPSKLLDNHHQSLITPSQFIQPEELPMFFNPHSEYLICSQDLFSPLVSANGITLDQVLQLKPSDVQKHLVSRTSLQKCSKSSIAVNQERLNESTTVPRKVDFDTAPTVTLVNAISHENLEWQQPVLELQKLPYYYMRLSKIRLTGLVVVTSLAGYLMAPAPTEPLVLISTAAGTLLTSCAANAINQFLEVPYDSQMNRTKNRVLVKGLLSPLHAVTFAVVCGTSGLLILTTGANGLTATLAAINLILYTSIYTPMKRSSIGNTWVGSIVGAIPPMMGWAACTGSLETGAWLLGAMLYSWQFPHFNALSWNLRPDYSRAGYRMMSVTDPGLCRRTALRHTVALSTFCIASPLVNLTTWTFTIISLPLNAYFMHCAYKFYKKGDSMTSRKLFRMSLLYLPALVVLMLINKYFSKEDDVKCKIDAC